MSISRADLIRYLSEQTAPVKKKTIADAFSIHGDDRVILKNLLHDLESDGVIIKHPGSKFALPGDLPDVMVLEISSPTKMKSASAPDTIWAMPTNIDQLGLENQQFKISILTDEKPNKRDLTPGMRVLARLRKLGNNRYEASILQRLDTPQAQIMGVVEKTRHGLIVKPVSKKAKFDFDLPEKNRNGAQNGDVVMAEVQPSLSKARGHARGGRIRKQVRIIETLGRRDDPGAISRISLNEEGLREGFTQNVLDETIGLKVPSLAQKEGQKKFQPREDLREFSLVTIDGADARDFDDAVFAQFLPDQDAYHIIVAIADVSYYVRPSSHLDVEAWTRGNSTYFPDRVVPMLPEALSNDLCSLRPDEDRACLAVHMWVDAKSGKLQRHKFVRGLMRSKARLTYEQVQAAKDAYSAESGAASLKNSPIDDIMMTEIITPLYDAFHVLKKARDKRGALDIDLPERQILIDDAGRMTGVKRRERLDSHMLIEEMMILANVAAALALEAKDAPCVYRIHDRPDMDRIFSAQNFLKTFNIDMARENISKPGQLNQILHKVDDHPCKDLVHETILRSQNAAIYSPENIGHFGLALPKYAHFTSPIRRYADLIVHRSLIRAYGLGPGGLSDDELPRLQESCTHISETERASMIAERNAVDRFAASYLTQRLDQTRSAHEPPPVFTGRIKSVTGFGLFVTLDETGVDGLVPIRSLGGDYFNHDEERHALIGERTGIVFRLGAPISVRVAEADGITGSAVFAPISPENGAEIDGFELDVKPNKSKRGRGRNYKGKGRGKNKNRDDKGNGPNNDTSSRTGKRKFKSTKKFDKNKRK